MFDPLLGWLDEHRRALGAAEDIQRDSAIVTAALARMTVLGERDELPVLTGDMLEPGRMLFGDHVGSLLDRLSTDYQGFSGEAASLVDGAASQALKGGSALYGDGVPAAQREAVLAQLEQGIETHGQSEVAAWVRGLVDEVEDKEVTATFEALVVPSDDRPQGFLDGGAPAGRRGEFAALLPSDRPTTPEPAESRQALPNLTTPEQTSLEPTSPLTGPSAEPSAENAKSAKRGNRDRTDRSGEGVPALVVAGLVAVLIVVGGALAYVLLGGDDTSTSSETTAVTDGADAAAQSGATDTTAQAASDGEAASDVAGDPDPTAVLAAPASATDTDTGDEACSAESNRAVQSALGESAGLSIFTLFVCEAGLGELLRSGDVGTALAPSDQAIGALGVDTISALRADAASLDVFVRAHLLPEQTPALRDGDVLVTLAENSLEVVADGAALSIAGVEIDSTTLSDELTVHQLSGVLANIQQTDPAG